MAAYFEAVVAAGAPAGEAANWMLGELSRVLNQGTPLAELKIRPEALAAVVQRKLEGALSNNQAKELFAALARSGTVVGSAEDVDAAIAAAGMSQVSDSSQLEAWVAEAIDAQPGAWADFAAGNERASGRLVGEVMRRSGGKASGPAVMEILRQRLQ